MRLFQHLNIATKPAKSQLHLMGKISKHNYKGNYGPEIPTKKGPYDFSSNSF